MTLDGGLELAVKSLDNPIGDGVVGRYADSYRANQCHQGIPQLGFELSPSVRGIVDGTPNRETYPWMNACATVSAVMSCIGKASGHRVYRSMQVRMYE